MVQVIVGDGESINSALRRFQRSVAKAGIFADMRKKQYFETALEKRRRKLKARRRQTKHRSR